MKRVCLLTGASGKFGNAFCDAFSSRYDVAAVFRKHPPLSAHAGARFVDPLSPASDLSENEHPVFTIRADLRQADEYERILELAFARFGRIDVVINAAARARRGSMLASKRLLESFHDQFQLNVFAPFHLSTLLMRRYWRQDVNANRAMNRNIINLSSTSATHLYRGEGQSVYSSAKAALNALTLHMADEFGVYGVRVNALAPDRFQTRVSLQTVLQETIKLDEGSRTGEIVELTSSRDLIG
jgi:NAD(P)-dependent dehydrogenase (short-subunit alcohol dehydrogenase family)